MEKQVFVFHGDDSFGMADARRSLEAKLLDPAWRDFNLAVLPSDTPLARVMDALSTVAFGGGNRVVVIKEPACLLGKSEDPGAEAFEAMLAAGLPPGGHLLLLLSKLDSRLRLAKKLTAVAVVREFGTAKPWQVEEQLGPWVEQLAGERQRRIGSDAVSALLAATGGDRWRIQREIEKLTTYASEGTRITAEMVRELVAGGEIEVFALTEAIARKQAGAALVAMERLLAGDHALKVLAGVVTVMRNWLRVKQLAESGLNAAAIAQATGARGDFKVRKDLELLRGWSAAALEAALAAWLEVDVAIKTGAWPAEQHGVLFTRAIAGMLGAPGSASR